MANDETGNADGIYIGSLDLSHPSAIVGDGDTSLFLSGTGTHVDLGDSYDFADEDFSVELWMKMEPLNAPVCQPHQQARRGEQRLGRLPRRS